MATAKLDFIQPPLYKNLFIYGLSSSEKPEEIRYIGYTTQKLNERLRTHIKEAVKLKTYKQKWISKTIKNNHIINITIIDEAIDTEDLKQKEIHYIKLFKSFGARLTNGTLGGEGRFGGTISHEGKLNISKKNSKSIYCFDYKSKKLVKKYNSVKEMKTELHLLNNGVFKVLNRINNQYKGYTFSFDGLFPLERKQNLYTRITLYNEKKSMDFNSVKSASEFLDIPRSTMLYHRKNNTYIKGYKVKITENVN